jgi:hypothetical protein
MKGSRSFSQA